MADGLNPTPAVVQVPPAVTADDLIEPFQDQTPAQLRADLEGLLCAATDCAQALNAQERSRSLSLVITKLEEAEMWSLRLDENGKEGEAT